MKILLTGATGFLGSHLLRELLENGHEVIILKRSTSNIWRIKDVFDQVKSYDSDDSFPLETVFEENENINAIIHTATCYGRKNEGTKEIFKANLELPMRLLNYGISFKVDAFYNIDTFFSANNDHGELNDYVQSKKQFLQIGQNLSVLNKSRFYNLKLEHLYGEFDDDSKFIPYVLNQCLSNQPSIDLTLGEQKRDFIYVKDVVKIINFLLQNEKLKMSLFKEVPIGTGKAIKIKNAVEIIKKLSDTKTKLNFGVLNYKKNESMDSKADLTSLRALGFNLKDFNSFENGLKRILKIENIITI